jgi:prepilin-type N-terminal cleavage/methylation domain-containing protein
MNQRGMTLIELIASITILSIVLLGIATIFPRGMGYTTQSRLLSQATNLTMQKAEEFERLPSNHPDLVNGTHTETVDNFTRTWVVSDVNTTAKIKRAAIWVTWLAPGAAMDSIGTTVFLYKP